MIRRSGSGLMGVNKVDGNISVSSLLLDSFCADDEARGGGVGDVEEAD
jgi:hypothetical protein